MRADAPSAGDHSHAVDYYRHDFGHGAASTSAQPRQRTLSGHYNGMNVQVAVPQTAHTVPALGTQHRTLWQGGRKKLGRLAKRLGLQGVRTARLPASGERPGVSRPQVQARLSGLTTTLEQQRQRDIAGGEPHRPAPPASPASAHTPYRPPTLADLFAADPHSSPGHTPRVTLADLLAAERPPSRNDLPLHEIGSQSSHGEIQPYESSGRIRHIPPRDAILHGLERQEQLKGKSIDPNVASLHMDYVEFDGIGRIQTFKTHDVPPHVLDALEAAQTIPLTRLNSPHPREVEKTERDSLVQFMALLRRIPGNAPQTLFEEGKAIWLSGDVSKNVAADYFRRAAHELRDIAGVRELAEDLYLHTQIDKEPAQYHENLYGRKFDSEVAHELIRTPPPALLDATRMLANTLIDRFDALFAQLDNVGQLDHLDGIHKMVDDDRRQWFSETLDLRYFADEPSIDALMNALEKVDDGFDVLKVNYLAVKLSMLGRDTAAKPWMDFADRNYDSVVRPQRSTDATGNEATTHGYGIRLHYQPEYEPFPQFDHAQSWADNKSPDLESLTPFEDMAIATGHPIVNGTSGSTNIMAFMLRHLSQTEPNFDARSALLGTMAFLVFDGGHSFNEAMAVSDTIDAHPGLSDPEAFDLDTIMERQTTMSDYFLDYQRLAGLSDRDAVEHALDTALTKTLDYFDDRSYFTQRNNEIVDGLRS